MDIEKIAQTMLANSERWFPSNHTTERAAVMHVTLGIAGEAGEVANKVKKLYGYMDQRNEVPDDAYANIVEECVDTLTYCLVLLEILGADIPNAILNKITICERRWGKK